MGQNAYGLRWHLTRGRLFKQQSGGKLVSHMPLAPDEEEYVDRVRALTETRDGILDDETKSTPKAFWPPGVTVGITPFVICILILKNDEEAVFRGKKCSDDITVKSAGGILGWMDGRLGVTVVLFISWNGMCMELGGEI